MNDNDIAPNVNPERFLSSRERAAYDFVVKMKQPGVSPHTQAKFFALFLQGTDCAEIARLNPGFSLGQIVAARVEGRWDEHRQEHVESLLRETRMRLQQTTLEGIEFIAGQLAAARKLYGDKTKKFLQSGDPADLGGFSIHGWKAYREAVDILKTLTGGDKTEKKVSGEILHKHEVSQSAPTSNRAMSTTVASTAVEQALAKKKA